MAASQRMVRGPWGRSGDEPTIRRALRRLSQRQLAQVITIGIDLMNEYAGDPDLEPDPWEDDVAV